MSEFDKITREGLIDMLEESQGLIAALQEKVEEYTETYNRVMSEQCAPDEQHCTCVPALRMEINTLRSNLAQREKYIKVIEANCEAVHSTNARLISTAAGRGMASEMDNPQEVAVLVCGLHDEIAQLKADRENAYKEIREYNTPMECGHLGRYVVNGDEGTQYCAMCNGNALLELGNKALAYIEKSNLVLKMYANRDNWQPYHNGTYILRTLAAPWWDAQEALRGNEDV